VPVFFQHQINQTSRLGIWKIEEPEDFFLGNVPLQQAVTHPHKRLQHLAGRFLLQFLYPGFPYDLIKIADTRKPYLPGDPFHFSISHCGDFAAAIVSTALRVGIDIEIPTPKVLRIQHKFLDDTEREIFFHGPPSDNDIECTTMLWSAKEAVYKWDGAGGVDFRNDIRLGKDSEIESGLSCRFTPLNQQLTVHYQQFDRLMLAWVTSKL
jgi:phosphopantetheinyl transferase